jgi:hypothetical protein
MPAFFRRADTALTRAGEAITGWVGTMWCAVLFAVIALTGLPSAIQAGQFVPWLAQSFLQLVLLSVIMVGQSTQAARQEALMQETHDTVMTELGELRAIVAAVHAEVTDA